MRKALSLVMLVVALAGLSCRTTRTVPFSGRPSAPVEPTKPAMPSKTLIDSILSDASEPLGRVLRAPGTYNLQVVYTRIDRRDSTRVRFTDHRFGVDRGRYFYPASTVKMPVAILALQRLRELGVPGLDRNSTMVTGAAYPGQTSVYNDPSSPDGRPTIAQYIRKIFLVSDNDAFNRLYEFLGPGYINRELQKRGYREAEIIHRLEVALSEDQNRHTNPVRFLDAGGRVLYDQPAAWHREPYALRSERLGKGYMRQGKLVPEPMDFSRKNRIALESLHAILRSVLFPESVPAAQRFNLSTEDLAFLRDCMSATPATAGMPAYAPGTYPETYCKFLYFGADPTLRIPEGMKVYNKVGDAYGHLLDIACFDDRRNGLTYLLSAVVYCNSDGILNDDAYDYDAVGFPVLREIGRLVHAFESSGGRLAR